MRTGRPPVAVAVVGHSGSGKTSLLEELIPALTARGVTLAAVKHAAHGFEADRPGMDSHRPHASGAEGVPPLPLPAVPLRRSEKKNPPKPPTIVTNSKEKTTGMGTRTAPRVPEESFRYAKQGVGTSAPKKVRRLAE